MTNIISRELFDGEQRLIDRINSMTLIELESFRESLSLVPLSDEGFAFLVEMTIRERELNLSN